MNSDVKFYHFLEKEGLLPPLAIAYQQWRDKENYVYYLQDLRIIKQALAKSYGEILKQIIMTTEPKNIESEFKKIRELLLKAIDEDAPKLYGDKPPTATNEVMDIIKRIKEKNETKKAQEQKKVLEAELEEEIAPDDIPF